MELKIDKNKGIGNVGNGYDTQHTMLLKLICGEGSRESNPYLSTLKIALPIKLFSPPKQVELISNNSLLVNIHS